MIIIHKELKINTDRGKNASLLLGNDILDINKVKTDLASFIGKLLRDNFGKGPESVFISLNKNVITIYLRQFISPMEKALLELEKEDLVQQTRDILMKGLIPEIKAIIKVLAGMEIEEFYFDWGMDNFSCMMVGISSDKTSLAQLAETDYLGKADLHQAIIDISDQVEKVPEKLYSFQLNDRTLVVIRIGILVSIEKELIRMGKRELLTLAKRKLEKRLLHNSNRFESILNAPVLDIFVGWDFDRDKSVCVFILEPKK